MGSSQSTQEQFVYPIESERDVRNRINAMFGASQPQQRQAKDTLHFSQFEIQRGGKRKRNRYAALENQLQRAMAGGGDSPCEQCSADVARKVADLINQVKLPVSPVVSELPGMEDKKEDKKEEIVMQSLSSEQPDATSPIGPETAMVQVDKLSATSVVPKNEKSNDVLSDTSQIQPEVVGPLSETSAQEVKKEDKPVEPNKQEQYSVTSVTPLTGGSKKKKNDSDDENDDSDDDTDSISDTSSDDDEHTTQTGGSEINIMQFFSSDGSEYYNNMQKRNRFT